MNAALNNSLRSMEMITPPVELKGYLTKVIQMYKHTINADPKEATQNAVVSK